MGSTLTVTQVLSLSRGRVDVHSETVMGLYLLGVGAEKKKMAVGKFLGGRVVKETSLANSMNV